MWILMTNTLAYLDEELIKTIKSFASTVHGVKASSRQWRRKKFSNIDNKDTHCKFLYGRN